MHEGRVALKQNAQCVWPLKLKLWLAVQASRGSKLVFKAEQILSVVCAKHASVNIDRGQ